MERLLTQRRVLSSYNSFDDAEIFFDENKTDGKTSIMSLALSIHSIHTIDPRLAGHSFN